MAIPCFPFRRDYNYMSLSAVLFYGLPSMDVQHDFHIKWCSCRLTVIRRVSQHLQIPLLPVWYLQMMFLQLYQISPPHSSIWGRLPTLTSVIDSQQQQTPLPSMDVQHDFHIKWCSCRLTVIRRVSLVEQELLTAPELLISSAVFSGAHVAT
jgi:hypothetical protein